MDGLEVAVADDREAGLDDIDIEAGKLARDLHFLAQVHGSAGALFAVAQGGVEDQDAVVRDPAEARVVDGHGGSRRLEGPGGLP